MSSFFAERALLPDGWAENVRFEVDDGGTLAAVTSGAEPGGAERLDGPTIPGLVNLHSHAFQRAMAGHAERASPGGDDFWSWREAMYGLVERVTPEQLRAVAGALYLELLCGGFTSVCEFHYLHHDRGGTPYDDVAETSVQVVEGARRAGIRITHLPVLYARGGFDGRALDGSQLRFRTDPETIAEIRERVTRHAAGDPRVRTGLALHSLRAVDPAMLRDAVAMADAGTPIHVHVAEQTREVDECVGAHGARPVEWLLANAPVDGRWCLVHATHMTEQETGALAASGAVAGLCPTTEANLGDGLFPFARYLAANGRFGVGTDSHVGRDAAGELRLLEYGQRLVERRRNVAAGERPSTGRSLWSAAARAGAIALGQPAGALEPGRCADLVVLDGASPELEGVDGDTILDVLVFSAGERLVKDVLAGGRWAVRGGAHVSGDAIGRDFRRALAELR